MRVSGIVAILMLVLSSARPLESRETKEKKTQFGTALQVGFAMAQYHDTCIMFRIYFISEEFFVGLRRNKPPDDSNFKKGSRAFRNFPDQLLVDVEATAFGCSGSPRREKAMPPDFGEGLLAAPQFEGIWKMGSEEYPAKIVSTQIQHKSHSLRWDYFLEIPANDIPLTAELIIDISMRSGVSHSRVSASLQ